MGETEAYESGYEANFETSPPEYLQCAICTLVLRDPVLMVDCGHRFCKGCYGKMKDYAKSINVPLLCPHDRQEIEEGKVFEDKGIARVVLDLKVKCDKFGKGCNWTGELRDLKSHTNGDCQPVGQQVDPLSLLSNFTRRLEQCEIRLNEKDIVIKKLEAEVQLHKTNFQGYKDYTKGEIEMLNERIKEFGQLLTVKDCQIQTLSEELNRSKTRIEEIEKTKKNHLEREQNTTENRKAISCQNLALGLFDDDQKQPTNLPQRNGPDLTPDDISKKIKELQERIMNVSEYVPHNKTVFDWTLYNYDKCEYEGETVYSPIFYSHWNGHSCQLALSWHGRQNGRLSLDLVVCKGIYEEVPRGRFQMAYTFEVENEYRQKKTSLITKRDVSKNFWQFYIHPYRNVSNGFGDEYFLTYPALADYVINDSLKIRCTLWTNTPSPDWFE